MTFKELQPGDNFDFIRPDNSLDIVPFRQMRKEAAGTYSDEYGRLCRIDRTSAPVYNIETIQFSFITEKRMHP